MRDARIVSTGAPGENITILKRGDESDHKHPPNRDECEAEVGFTILGLIKKNVLNIDDDTPKDELTLPLVFALLSSKETAQYSAVLTAVERAGQEFHIDNCRPTKVITDFEKEL
ncbi:unnamed protein product [Ceratitis capitata]|uniref:(Mediterranean fruit fly) hypothetical protein n=1 Tax=Ceratitis capitata TaxID=7213 RepID=A0A811UK73_CERCA|nr:unnamed protein product [Ceratitis capitata]